MGIHGESITKREAVEILMADVCDCGKRKRKKQVVRMRELQWKLIYSILVAGKSARFADSKIDLFFGKDDMSLPSGGID